jgi:hypothetical protein
MASTTVTVVKTGTHLVEIDLPPSLANAKIYEFRVRHDDGSFEHFGVSLFDRREALD